MQKNKKKILRTEKASIHSKENSIHEKNVSASFIWKVSALFKNFVEHEIYKFFSPMAFVIAFFDLTYRMQGFEYGVLDWEVAVSVLDFFVNIYFICGGIFYLLSFYVSVNIEYETMPKNFILRAYTYLRLSGLVPIIIGIFCSLWTISS